MPPIALLAQYSSAPCASSAEQFSPRGRTQARKKIAEAQRKRWAAAKGNVKGIPAKGATEVAPPAKKPGMSTAARKRIAAAQKKRWAAVKAAKETAKKTPAKKVAKKAPATKAVAPKKVAAKKSPAVKAKKAAAASTEAAPA